MNGAELFEKLADHLLTQGVRSSVWVTTSEQQSVESCQYRGPNGLKCPVGACISDEEYCEEMEGQSVDSMMWSSSRSRLTEETKILFRENLKVLQDFQNLHDSESPKNWVREIGMLRLKYGRFPV